MPYSPFVVERFGGLNLRDDPEEIGAQGAIDMFNVDLDKQGRVRSRDGFDNFTASAAANPLNSVAAFYKTDGTKQVLVSSTAGNFYRAYSTAGATVASQALPNSAFQTDFTRFGGPAAEVIYAASLAVDPALTAPLSNIVYKWSGAAWAVAAVRLGGVGVYPYALEVQSTDNRLVGVFSDSNASRVGFSNAGVPETWSANDYVDLTPGDGERIISLVSWRELVFVFKETKFFVFTGNSTGGDGNPIFNYRPVATGVGSISRAACAATPSGVYFLSRRGIYKTVGGDPVLVSRDVDPIFRGGASSFYGGGVLNHAALDKSVLAWHDERLYFAFPSGSSTTNDRLLVFDPENNYWTLWNIPAAGMTSFRVGDSADLIFSYATGSNHLGRVSSSYTDDDGTAIATRYQSGLYDVGEPGADTYLRQIRAIGTGAPTLSVLTDYGSTDANAGTITLGTSPAIAEGIRAQAYKGRLFSHKLSATSGAWSVNRIIEDVAWTRP